MYMYLYAFTTCFYPKTIILISGLTRVEKMIARRPYIRLRHSIVVRKSKGEATAAHT